MTEEKTKKKTTSKKKDSDKITLSKNELSEIITNALLDYDKKKEELKYEQSKKPKQKLTFKQKLMIIANPKKYLNEKGSNAVFVKGLITSFYSFLKWTLLIFSVALIAYIPLQFMVESIERVPWYINFVYVGFSVCSILLSRIFVVLSVEVEKSNDSNFLMTIFALIISIVSMIIAIIK